jgi:hypothetical protein
MSGSLPETQVGEGNTINRGVSAGPIITGIPECMAFEKVHSDLCPVSFKTTTKQIEIICPGPPFGKIGGGNKYILFRNLVHALQFLHRSKDPYIIAPYIVYKPIGY